jgi:hypothetical protein
MFPDLLAELLAHSLQPFFATRRPRTNEDRRTKMRLNSLLVVGLAVGVGCSGGVGGTNYGLGDESFSSQPLQGGSGRGGSGGVLAASDAAGAPGTASASPSRAIQEADIYKVVGNQLYILNQFRGLQIVDITDLTQPKLLARVPMVGRPIDLYVDNGTAYLTVSDYFMYGYYLEGDVAGGAVSNIAGPTRGSQVWAVDVTTPAAPKVLTTLGLEGEIDTTRIVGNILYVVSHRYPSYEVGADATDNRDLTYIASFDVSNPASMKAVDRVDFPTGGWDVHANVTQNRITLSQSAWQTNGPITQFQVIDISDPAGKLAIGASFDAAGMIKDRWAMDFDDVSGVFRAVLQKDWGNSGATLADFSSPNVKTVTRVGTLDLNIAEAVTAARFDGNRAYVVTAACTDPLWIADTTDPTLPVLNGSVSMTGSLDFVEPRGDRIVALGHDGAGCHGGSSGWGLAVSLFDVADPTKPSMLSRVDFGSGYTYINATADDMRKVFQVLDNLSLILVPFQSWNSDNWSYEGGTQLIDYSASGLTLRGFADHAGSITRAFPVADKLVALSDQSLQVIDATDRDHPATVADIDLARPVSTLAVLHGDAVELSGDWYRGDTRLVVTDAKNPDDPTPLASIKIPAPYARMFRDGDIVWLLARDYQGNGKAWIQAVDLSNPAAPRPRGRLDLDPTTVGYWGGGWYQWGWGDEAALAGHALAIHRSYYYYWYDCAGCGYPQQPPDQVLTIDLSNPDAPKLGPALTLEGSSWSWGLQAVGSFAWITHYEWLPGDQTNPNGHVRYFIDRIDLTDPSNPKLLAKINVPGVFFAASSDGATVFTEDLTYNPTTWTDVRTHLNKLVLTNHGTARLVGSISINGYPGGSALFGNHAYLENWDWSAQTQSQATLAAIDLGSMRLTSTQTLASQWAWIMEATGGKLFLSAGWYDQGILIYDLIADAGKPTFQQFVRTEGWVEDVVVDGTTAYLPSGDYGVPMVQLVSP